MSEYIATIEDGAFIRCDFAQPIVRCRDCKHYRKHEWIIATDVSDVCMFFADGVKVEPNGFCAWGERRCE